MEDPVGMSWVRNSYTGAWLWLVSALNLSALLALLLFALVKIPATMYWVSDGVDVLWCIAVFVSIPVGIIALLILRRRTPWRTSGAADYYVRGSYIFLTIAWLCLAPISLFWGAIYIHIFDPWPFSMAQGPDNEKARNGFKRLLGVEPNASVHSIYYRVIAVRDASHFLRFNYSDPETLKRIIASHDLVALDAETRERKRLTYLSEDDTMARWWTAEEIGATPRVYVDRELYENFTHVPVSGSDKLCH